MRTKCMLGMFLMGMLLFIGAVVFATPSTTYWSPCVMDVQPAGVWHLTYDTYSTRRAGGDFPTDLGLTYGFKLSEDVNAETRE